MSRTAFVDVGDPGAPVNSAPWCRYAHSVLCSSKRRTNSEVAGFKYSLIEFKKFDRWKQLADNDGRPFMSWEDYLQYPEPNGLGMPTASVKLVMEELDDNRLLGDVLGSHGGDRRSEQAKDQACNTSLKYGTAKYWCARLDRDGLTDLAAKVRAGELSANAAAIEAGFRKQPSPFQQVQKLLSKLTAKELRALLRELQDRCRDAA